MFAKEKRSRFHRLPKELIIYIYSYDNTYRKKYNKCLNEMINMYHLSMPPLSSKVDINPNILLNYMIKNDCTLDDLQEMYECSMLKMEMI